MATTLNDLLSGTGFSLQSNLTTQDILLSLLVTFVLSLFIFFIYKKTYAAVLYSRDFNITLIIVSMVVTVIMLGISRNLALSLGLIGALSIVRFRNAIKDPKDIAFLFWSISTGIVNGVQFYKLSLISSAVIGLVLLVLGKRLTINQPYLVIIKSNKEGVENDTLINVLRKNCLKYRVRSSSISDDISDLSIEVKLKKGKESVIAKELKSIRNVSKVNMFSFNGDLSD